MSMTFEGKVRSAKTLVHLVDAVNKGLDACGTDAEAHLNIARARIDALIKNGAESTVRVFVQQCKVRALRNFAIDRYIAYKGKISPEELGVFAGVILQSNPADEESKQLLQRIMNAAEATAAPSTVVRMWFAVEPNEEAGTVH